MNNVEIMSAAEFQVFERALYKVCFASSLWLLLLVFFAA